MCGSGDEWSEMSPIFGSAFGSVCLRGAKI